MITNLNNLKVFSRLRNYARHGLQYLERMHRNMHNKYIFQVFTAFTRCILAIGFIPPSIPKILHKPFTSLEANNPVGAYFKALFETGYYYDFIGWSQLLAAALLIIPRTAHLGAILFFPIILNIAVLTNAVGFKGTWLITILMLLANLYLICWEYDRIKPWIIQSRINSSKMIKKDVWRMPLFFGSGGLGMVMLMYFLGIIKSNQFSIMRIIPFVVAGALFGLVVYFHSRHMKTGVL